MSLVGDFKARLAAINPQPFRLIEGAAEFAAIERSGPAAAPAAYVFVKEEVSSENHRMTGPVLQRCEADVAVIIVTDNVSDATGGAAAGDLEALKRAIRDALVGFIPPSGDEAEPVEHVSGQVIKFRSGAVWQEELFATAFYIEEQS